MKFIKYIEESDSTSSEQGFLFFYKVDEGEEYLRLYKFALTDTSYKETEIEIFLARE